MNPKISVVVPVYNVEKYINRCVESILNQTYKNIEIILVDDGSTDNSGILCDEYKSEKVKIVRQKNQGLPAARNTGVKNATGDYIFFLDSDDWLDERLIETLVNYRKDNILVGCNLKNIFKNKKTIHSRIGNHRKDIFLKDIISNKKPAFVVGYLFDAKICKKICFNEKTRFFEDLAYLIKYLKNSKEDTISFDGTAFYNYYQNPNSITLSRNNLEDKVKDLFITTKEINRETDSIYKNELENREIEILEALLQDSDKTMLKKIVEKFPLPTYTGNTRRIKVFAKNYNERKINNLTRYYKFRKIGKKVILKLNMV